MNAVTATDAQHLERAIDLAARGVGQVTPNPNVGAVVARADGEVVGEGWHEVYGGAHAEVNALRAAREAALGAAMYSSPEPFFHQGKPPPCTDAIVAAGIARVVIASDDPSEKAN